MGEVIQRGRWPVKGGLEPWVVQCRTLPTPRPCMPTGPPILLMTSAELF